MTGTLVILMALAYLAFLFSLAYVIDRKPPGATFKKWAVWIYALALPVYCTAWTFYGSVGKAAVDGWSFLTIYLGPVIMMPLLWLVVRKIIRICKVQNLNTLPDFISSRYNSVTLSVISSVFMVVGIIPYISIQLKAIKQSFEFLVTKGEVAETTSASLVLTDSALYLSIILGLFIILFVFRSVETTGQHRGLMAAIAMDSVVKLLAFMAVGIFVTYFLFDGFADLFSKADEQLLLPFVDMTGIGGLDWFFLLLLSMSAIVLLPRQFQVMVAENTDENHLKKAAWVFPAYLLLINLFVVPVALGGQLLLGGSIDPDSYVLALPLLFDKPMLALITFLGGFSAATGMIIVSVTSLSLMLSNNVILPIIARKGLQSSLRSGVAVRARQIAVVIIMLFAFFYYSYIADLFPLVSIGLISFAAIIQFAPSVLGALFWKDANRQGAIWGLVAGFGIWFYTLVIPTMVVVGWLPESVLVDGPFGISWLNPQALFGLQMEPLSHGAFWSLLFNVLLFLAGSLSRAQSAKERNMAELYAGIYNYATMRDEKILWKGEMVFNDLVQVSRNLLGEKRSKETVSHYIKQFGKPVNGHGQVDARFVNYTQRLLSGVVGSTSARVLISSLAKEEEIELKEVVKLLKETSETSKLNSQLRLQSLELKRKTEELLSANDRLKDIDKEKDDFISTVTHELRTPLTAIKAFVEILQDHADVSPEEQHQFLQTINDEIDRMSRLIDQVLDLEKLESGVITMAREPVYPVQIMKTCLDGMRPMLESKSIQLVTQVEEQLEACEIMGDADRLKQAFLNLISNAAKYTLEGQPLIEVAIAAKEEMLELSVTDNGKGIQPENQERIFEKFFQARDQTRKKPKGTGLGLPITRKIIELHGGNISVFSEWGNGAVFTIRIPIYAEVEPQEILEKAEHE